MKHLRTTTISALMICALSLPLSGCGDDDNSTIILTPTPGRTSTPGGNNPTPTNTPIAATATPNEQPTETPTGDTETPTPVPTGVACGSSTVAVAVSISNDYGAARIDLQYPGTEINLPGSGSGTDVSSRVVFGASGGLTTVNDDDNTSTLTTSFVGFNEQPAGAFATITFDCVNALPAPSAFACTVVSASTPGGVAIPASCTVGVQ